MCHNFLDKRVLTVTMFSCKYNRFPSESNVSLNVKCIRSVSKDKMP